MACKGVPGLLIDVDLRYFDYANTPLFGQRVIDGGLNWNSIFAVATGIQYQAPRTRASSRHFKGLRDARVAAKRVAPL